jgi:2-amino-4-hydroxy-6-hydroxymethyldihydropteridine diphosphokinase
MAFGVKLSVWMGFGRAWAGVFAAVAVAGAEKECVAAIHHPPGVDNTIPQDNTFQAVMNLDDFRIFVAFGGNEGDPAEMLRRAVDLLQIPLGPLKNASSIYETRALTMDGIEQPNYLNAVFEFSSALAPSDVLRILLDTEKTLGRQRLESRRWAPRPIDLDLLFAGHRIESNGFIALPHPELHKRDFVLTPLCEIAPDFVHPVLGKTIEELESTLDSRGLERFVVGRHSSPFGRHGG